MDRRFLANAIAPYLLTQRLLPLLPSHGRVINLSSAAQSAVDLKALSGKVSLTDSQAYAQSKLVLTMWSFQLARRRWTRLDPGVLLIQFNQGLLGDDDGFSTWRWASKTELQAAGISGAGCLVR